MIFTLMVVTTIFSSILLLLPLSQIQILLSATCSHTPTHPYRTIN